MIDSIYEVKTEIDQDIPHNQKYNFVIRETQPLEMVMDMLMFVAPIKYSINEDTVRIIPNS